MSTTMRAQRNIGARSEDEGAASAGELFEPAQLKAQPKRSIAQRGETTKGGPEGVKSAISNTTGTSESSSIQFGTNTCHLSNGKQICDSHRHYNVSSSNTSMMPCNNRVNSATKN